MTENREITSKETIVSSGSMVVFEISAANSAEFVTEKPFRFCNGDNIDVKSFKAL